ncbi:hypothetical protein BFP77_08355 [Maribacter sp. 4U21]|uniref:DUF6046 domain-containing protein n=1 Tax=Maribacter sp. 4U21 TaxID=1889779 RepID=UPI000C15CF29|nr:DUF6046 domain-containing protein [Maribacter sp. 4U21]PIB28919.1 hypothetical protein BFP77_08355 [Maribacter sp. 4U21]
MANEFNIRSLTAGAFNYVGLPYPLLGFEDVDLPNLNRLGRAVLGKDLLGRPFFMDCTIDGVRLPNEPLITISGRKNIVETIIVGSERKGTVKEFISAEDYKIKIEGLCIDPANKVYPEEQVRQIIDVCERAEPLGFTNAFAALFRIGSIVIKDYGFGNMKGKPYSQSYYIDAVSNYDYRVELLLGQESENADLNLL